MHSVACGCSGDHRPSRGSRNGAAVDKLRRSEAPASNHNARDFVVPDQFQPSKPSSLRNTDRNLENRNHHGECGGREVTNYDDRESVGSSPTPPPELAHPVTARAHSQPGRSPSDGKTGGSSSNWDLPLPAPKKRSPGSRCRDSMPVMDNLDTYTNGEGLRVPETRASGRRSPGDCGLRRDIPPTSSTATDGDMTANNNDNGDSKLQNDETIDDEGDGGGCRSNRSYSARAVHVPNLAKWRCFGRRPPAILEFRPMGEPRTRNVRPAGKQSYLMRRADEKRGCDSRIFEGDLWDDNYGLTKPITERWTASLPYGETRVIRTGDVDPWFKPARGDLIIINPAQNYYKAMKLGYTISFRGSYTFRIGDLVLRLGKFLPSGQYVPYGNLELYMYTPSTKWRFLGRQPYLLVDFNYHNLDYESPGKYLAIGAFLTESFKPRRGDIIIRGGSWAENYPNTDRRHHSFVRYWRPNTEFLPNDMLLRPYVDIGSCERMGEFYWGAAELYSYSGKGLSWAYWGRDHHVLDTPFPAWDNEPIKTGHHKDETGHYGSDNFEHRGA